MLTLGDPEKVGAWCEEQRQKGRRVGLVPTMGSLHAGHVSLIRRAAELTDVVVVSIFVNPLQFGPNEDLAAYPRDLRGDTQQCVDEGVALLFAPTVQQMYPRGVETVVNVPTLATGLCGASRPGHFEGVCLVVARLFNLVGRCVAVFGEKDYQQLAIVRRMATDLALPVEVVGGAIVREADGLALSSRNAYLSAEQRRAATVLCRALRQARDAARAGDVSAEEAVAKVRAVVREEPLVRLEYVGVVDNMTLEPLPRAVVDQTVIALAAQVGDTRLIDNIRV